VLDGCGAERDEVVRVCWWWRVGAVRRGVDASGGCWSGRMIELITDDVTMHRQCNAVRE
jgi:hypothetical protein